MGLYRRDKHKVWWISFTHKGRQVRRSTETTDKRLAQKVYAKVQTQVVEGKWFDVDEGKKRTFKELAEKYEAQVFKELKSWRSTQSYLDQLKKFFGSYTLAEINPALIDDFKQMRKAKGVKPATINRQLSIMRRMLNLAKKRWLWIKEVPPIEMEPKADKKRTRHLSFEEFHKLLNCCDNWLKDIVAVAAWTGMRQGNIIHLKRTQVNLVARTITLEGEETKNGEKLVIPIATPALEVLKRAMKVVNIKSPYIFYREDNRPHYKREIQRAIKKALDLAGIEDFRFHDLRHCFASWNRQAGVDIDTLADLMGHKDTRMTRRYAHITPVHLTSAVGLLEESYHDFITLQKKRATENSVTP